MITFADLFDTPLDAMACAHGIPASGYCADCDSPAWLPEVMPAPSYCADCDETYTAGAVARRCAVHAAARDSRLAAWHAAGGSGAHYLSDEEDTPC